MKVSGEITALLQYAWQTSNPVAFPVSGTGTAAMECAVCNCVWPGDRMLVFVAGYFGDRLAEMGTRYGAAVTRVEAPWGTAFPIEVRQLFLRARVFDRVRVVRARVRVRVVQLV